MEGDSFVAYMLRLKVEVMRLVSEVSKGKHERGGSRIIYRLMQILRQKFNSLT